MHQEVAKTFNVNILYASRATDLPRGEGKK